MNILEVNWDDYKIEPTQFKALWDGYLDETKSIRDTTLPRDARLRELDNIIRLQIQMIENEEDPAPKYLAVNINDHRMFIGYLGWLLILKAKLLYGCEVLAP